MMLSREVCRQWFLIVFFLFVILLPYLPVSWAFFLAICGFIHNVFFLPKYAPHIFRQQEGFLQGIAVYPLMIALLILLLPGQMIVVAGAWALLGVGDGAATVVGTKWPLYPLPWNPRKSLGGTLGFSGFGALAAILAMVWTGPVDSWIHLFWVAVITAMITSIYESLLTPIDDNISVSLSAAVFGYLFWNLSISFELTGISPSAWIYGIAVNVFLAVLAYQFRLISFSGLLGGVPMGILILLFGGLPLFALLLLFFILGCFVTHFGYDEKVKMGIAQEREGRRGARHAFANVFFALIAAILLGITGGADPVLKIAFTAVLATALSDTVATEIGQLFGHNPFLPTSFRIVPPGTAGAISVEGTLYGMAAAFIFALMAWAFMVITFAMIPPVVLGAWLGFFMESYIKAFWLEKEVTISGNWMNWLNTFIGATIAVALSVVTGIII